MSKVVVKITMVTKWLQVFTAFTFTLELRLRSLLAFCVTSTVLALALRQYEGKIIASGCLCSLYVQFTAPVCPNVCPVSLCAQPLPSWLPVPLYVQWAPV